MALLEGKAMSNVDAAWLHMESATNLMLIAGVMVFYEKIEFLVPLLRQEEALLDEYKWSVVLSYLLLKILGKNVAQFHKKYQVNPE